MAPVVACLVLAGCSTPAAGPSQRDADVARVTHLENAPLLYLLASPHARLYVEVDAVEGCTPKDVALQQLRNFLSAHCNKPEGIEIVRSDVISIKAARGVSPGALARNYLNGPDRTNASPPAFMYVLYYDYGLSRDFGAARILHRGANTVPPRRAQTPLPYAEVYPYPAIYFNTRFSMGLALNEILLHETGHLLGLVNRPVRGRQGHCRNSGCQMTGHFDYVRQFRWLPGRQQTRLCDECVVELKERSTQPSPSNLRFIGPILVRSESDYHVASLPGRTGLLVGNLAEQDCRNFLAVVRAEEPAPGEDERMRLFCLVKDDALPEPAKLSNIVHRLKADPDLSVRPAGPAIVLEACSHRYQLLGQYSKAVDALHQAILLDAKNARTYNALAWMKSTCPDASIRNGAEAIAAARKACDLAQWKNWIFIDTLAAAYAEAGDFKRAIEFQDQALRTGNPGVSQQNQMRERLGLYEQSQPFREKAEKE